MKCPEGIWYPKAQNSKKKPFFIHYLVLLSTGKIQHRKIWVTPNLNSSRLILNLFPRDKNLVEEGVDK